MGVEETGSQGQDRVFRIVGCQPDSALVAGLPFDFAAGRVVETGNPVLITQLARRSG